MWILASDKPVALSKSLDQEDFAFSSHKNVELFSEKKRIFPYLQEYKKIRYRYDFGDGWIQEQNWQPFDIQRINQRLMFTIS